MTLTATISQQRNIITKENQTLFITWQRGSCQVQGRWDLGVFLQVFAAGRPQDRTCSRTPWRISCSHFQRGRKCCGQIGWMSGGPLPVFSPEAPPSSLPFPCPPGCSSSGGPPCRRRSQTHRGPSDISPVNGGGRGREGGVTRLLST